MDEYLDEEVEAVKLAFDVICKGWDREVMSPTTSRKAINPLMQASASSPTQARQFLSTQNPALLKRNVLASFTGLLLLPVTIVPRTVGAVGGALMTGGSAAVQGIAMLNPQRWGGSSSGTGAGAGYSRNLEKQNGMLFEVDEKEEDYVPSMRASVPDKSSGFFLSFPSYSSGVDILPIVSLNHLEITSPTPLMGNRSASPLPSGASGDAATHQLDLLLSLDVALELIHADRESLKRVETFAGYPGHYGHRVRDTVEELFILMLQALGDQHVSKGFSQCVFLFLFKNH